MFEYAPDFASASASVRDFVNAFGIDYPVLIAGSEAALGRARSLSASLEQASSARIERLRDGARTDAWARAHQARLDAGEFEDAVRCAFWLGYGLIAVVG